MTTHHMYDFQEVLYADHWQQRVSTGSFILAGDIGGTNSNFAIIEYRDGKPVICASFHAKSQKILDYHQLLTELLHHIEKHYRLTITRACWGAAGIVSANRTRVKPTNLTVTLDASAIMSQSSVTELILINDFEAVALGIDHVAPETILIIHPGTPEQDAQRACIGAGTGLGKAALVWSKQANCYIPIVSEGGHADCTAETDAERAFLAFVHSERQMSCPISWEDVLSGNGVSALYQFLGTQKNYHRTPVSEEIEVTGFKPDRISRYAHEDTRCFDTFGMYATFYARCAKNFALDLLARGGLYISGGIAARNAKFFATEEFRETFFSCGKQEHLLRSIPLSVITDYNINLYGAAVFLQLRDQGIV